MKHFFSMTPSRAERARERERERQRERERRKRMSDFPLVVKMSGNGDTTREQMSVH